MAESTITAAPIQIVISGAQGPVSGSSLPVLTGVLDPNESSVVAGGVGQQYRQGSESPFVWWKWDGTTWVPDTAGGLTLSRGVWRTQVEDGTILKDFLKVRD